MRNTDRARWWLRPHDVQSLPVELLVMLIQMEILKVSPSLFGSWQCGKIMRSSSKLLFGSHCDRLQLFGCPEKFCKENRAACYAARSALFVGKVTVAVVAGPPVIVCAALFYTGPKFLIENVQMMRRRRQREQAQRSRAMAQ